MARAPGVGATQQRTNGSAVAASRLCIGLFDIEMLPGAPVLNRERVAQSSGKQLATERMMQTRAWNTRLPELFVKAKTERCLVRRDRWANPFQHQIRSAGLYTCHAAAKSLQHWPNLEISTAGISVLLKNGLDRIRTVQGRSNRLRNLHNGYRMEPVHSW